MAEKIFAPILARFPWRLVGSTFLLALSLVSTTVRSHEAGDPSGLEILVVGATSRTANGLIPQAPWRGHEVIAFARRPYRVRIGGHESRQNVSSHTGSYKRISPQNHSNFRRWSIMHRKGNI